MMLIHMTVVKRHKHDYDYDAHIIDDYISSAVRTISTILMGSFAGVRTEKNQEGMDR